MLSHRSVWRNGSEARAYHRRGLLALLRGRRDRGGARAGVVGCGALMPRGVHPASRANLIPGGGDRHAGKRAVIAAIEAALLVGADDVEVARWAGRAVERVGQKQRVGWARERAPKVYRAILDGWTAGMMEPLYDAAGNAAGVNIGGILRLGQVPRLSVTVTATDGNGVDLKAAGVVIYRRVVPENGIYASVPVTEGGAAVTFDGVTYYGPLPYLAGLLYHAEAGGFTTAQAIHWGTVGDDDVTRAWYYRDAMDVERRVVWESSTDEIGGTALGWIVPNRFFADLNGWVPD